MFVLECVSVNTLENSECHWRPYVTSPERQLCVFVPMWSVNTNFLFEIGARGGAVG
jgi:hypothetical protein